MATTELHTYHLTGFAPALGRDTELLVEARDPEDARRLAAETEPGFEPVDVLDPERGRLMKPSEALRRRLGRKPAPDPNTVLGSVPHDGEDRLMRKALSANWRDEAPKETERLKRRRARREKDGGE